MPSAQKIRQPVVGELFTTAFSHVTPAAAIVCPSPALNYSPAPQVFGPNGELIAPPTAESQASSEIEPGIIHHAACQAGEKVGPPRRGGPDVALDPPLASQNPDGVRVLPFSARNSAHQHAAIANEIDFTIVGGKVVYEWTK